MVELLAPVGDFECLKAAVQNGADAVYFGGGNFNARASAHNFDNDELKEAIRYAKLRNVKINFTLNTLLKNEEFDAAIELAKRIYELSCLLTLSCAERTYPLFSIKSTLLYI